MYALFWGHKLAIHWEYKRIRGVQFVPVSESNAG